MLVFAVDAEVGFPVCPVVLSAFGANGFPKHIVAQPGGWDLHDVSFGKTDCSTMTKWGTR